MAFAERETMRICANGHVLSAKEPEKDFCSECGAPVLSRCPACSEPIVSTVQPLQRLQGALGFATHDRPKYCSKCGKPFPWHEQTVRFLKDLGGEAGLSKEELEAYERSVDDVAQNNVRAVRSAARVLAVALKLGKPAYSEASTLMKDLASPDVLVSLGLAE